MTPLAKGAPHPPSGEGPGETWTPLRILQWAVPFLKDKGLPHPRLDAEVLLAHALGVGRLDIYLQYDRPLGKDELSLIRDLFKRRAQQEPIQYITGTREFFGFPFGVRPGVLIPRPETEHLVELALGILREVPETERTVLDLGTGSGCIGVSLAKSIPCRVWGVDTSEMALEVAAENAKALGVEHSFHLRKGDWFDALQDQDPLQFRLIVSNPPYIALSEKEGLSKEVEGFEPFEALFGGGDGFEPYRKIAMKCFEKLLPDGDLLLEMHPERWEGVAGMFQTPPWGPKGIHKDLSGLPRVLSIKKGTIN